MMDKYLLNPAKPKGVAHIMRGTDTACRMLSTGGIPRDRYKVFKTQEGRSICTMCSKVANSAPAIPAEPDPEHMTRAEYRALRLFSEPGASICVGLSIHACLARRGLLVARDGERSGRRYFLTAAGKAILAGEAL